MPAQGRLKPFWRKLAVQLAADEVQEIKRELGMPNVAWEFPIDHFRLRWGPPIDPQELAAAKEQWKAVIANGRSNES